MGGYLVETMQKPQWKSVEEYRQHLLKESPNPDLKNKLFEPDIHCTCCGQGAPHVAAAMLKVEDTTPYNVNLAGDPGHTIWLCADCYVHGVRPKSIHYGNVRWNKEGRKVKQQAESPGADPW